MFKTLISTFLLCSVVGANPIKQNHYNANGDGNNNYLLGAYNFKGGVIDFEMDVDDLPLNLTLETSATSTLSFPCYVNSYYGYLREINFYQYDSFFDTLGVQLLFNLADDTPSTPNKNYEVGVINHNGLLGSAREVILYFQNPIYVDRVFLDYFNSVFTHDDTEYVTSYNGYYSMTNDVSGSFGVYGSCIFDNNLYNCFFKLSNSNTYDFRYYDYGTNRYTFNKVSSIPSTKNILLSNCKMTVATYNKLSNAGVFSYVPPSESVSFGDMIFSVVDAPIYMLSQLFSFELFGIEFYVAFTSILTVLIIAIVVRKVI